MPQRYCLGPDERFVLDLSAHKLLADGAVVPMGSRALDLLACLVESGGTVLTKDQLLQRAWPGLVVEEANVQVQVSHLRRLLGAEAIVTVPGVGYRLAWPVAPARDEVASSLPAARTSFIGREAALNEVMDRLAAVRLVTLTGIGGTGKTRLALRVGERCRLAYANGVWWVDLAALEHADQIAPAVLRTLGALQPADCGPVEGVERAIGGRNMLLVMDNCEHLLAACAQRVDRWLAACPHLRVLATSRESLAVPGEAVLPVRPLSVPAAHQADDGLLEAEALQLLLDRARSAAPQLRVDAGSLRTLAEISRCVDGIPLAIELAAAQLRVVTPVQLLDMLRQHIGVLAGTDHAPPRQSTMQAVIAWSYDRLAGIEQRLLGALALCGGGCDLDAVVALMGPEVPRGRVIEALGRLADRSLLIVQHGPAQARYLLLETVRQHALDRLQGTSLGVTLSDRHVAHFLQLAERHDAEILQHGNAAASRAHMDLERENLLRALDACARDERPAAAGLDLRLVVALRHYWTSSGLNALGLAATLAALDRAQGRPVDRHHLLALLSAAWMDNAGGRFSDSLRLSEQCLALAQAAGDAEQVVEAHRGMGISLRALGRLDRAEQEHRIALALARDLHDDMVLTDALQSLAVTLGACGKLDESAQLAEDVLSTRRRSRHGDFRLVEALHNAAQAARALGDGAQARSRLAEAQDLLPRVGSALLEVSQLDLAAQLAVHERDWRAAMRLRSASLARARALGLVYLDGDDRAHAAAVQQARQALGAAQVDADLAEGAALSHAQALQVAAAWLRAPGRAG